MEQKKIRASRTSWVTILMAIVVVAMLIFFPIKALEGMNPQEPLEALLMTMIICFFSGILLWAIGGAIFLLLIYYPNERKKIRAIQGPQKRGELRWRRSFR